MRRPLRLNEVIPLERLSEERYSKVLCYPKFDSIELKRRLNELKKLNVTTIEFSGEKSVFNVSVLGKGCVGIVVAAYTHSEKVAVKIRRVDADRAGMQCEAQMLKKANIAGVGPCLLDVTENFLVMEFIGGRLLPQWVEELKGRGKRVKICWMLRAILEQCWALDEIGMDHGQLRKAPKHIIIDEEDNPHIVDFETASITRRVSNVTSICNYLFIGSQIARKISRELGEINRSRLINTLRNYKKQRTRENFEKILDVGGLYKILPAPRASSATSQR